MLESTLERKVCRYVRKCGGTTYKWISPGRTGVPDRIFLFPGGIIIFVELKRPGRENGLSPRQKKVLSELEKFGCNTLVVNDFEDFKITLKERFGIDEV